jgi:hypothetical protein
LIADGRFPYGGSANAGQSRFGMPLAPSTSALGATFNPFLFASVVEDGETPLNVVSVLARLDLDPWQEAAELSDLRGEAAADRLASLLARCPALIRPDPDLELMAQRLVALLPRSTVAQAPSRVGWFGAEIKLDPMVVTVMALVVGMAFMAALSATGAHVPQAVVTAPQAVESSPLPSPAGPHSAK